MNIQIMVSILQMILAFGNICIMFYAFSKFLSKPHDSLEERVTALEVKSREIEQKLFQGNDRFRTHGNVLEVLVRCTLALIDFEIHYCETEHKDISQDLENARRELHSCLSRGTNNNN